MRSAFFKVVSICLLVSLAQATKVCPNCGQEYPDDYNYCTQCVVNGKGVALKKEIKDADINSVEFIMVDEKAHPVNINEIRPEFPVKYREDSKYISKPVKVALMVYVGSNGKVKNILDTTIDTIPKEFKENAYKAVESIDWVPAKIKGTAVGTWFTFDIIFRVK